MAEPGNAQGHGALTQAMTKPGGDPLLATVLLGRYRIDKRLGEGGMGTVYLAEHMTIRKKVAVKVLAADMGQKPDVRARFLQEAQAASMVHQQNIVEITDYGDTPDGRAFFIMEFLDGEDLSNTVEREGGLPWLRVRPMLTQICEALQAAHDAGIIHRDMKPENCYRIKRGGSDDFIKVLDFGIAKVSSVEEEGGKGLTKTGMIFGTPEYMSPEQAQGQKVDHRVDIYAMGVIMFELLTGQTPFQGDTFMSILTKHLFEAPPAPLSVNPQADISPEIEAIMLKAMQKDPALRFGSMAEMSAAISAVGTGAAAVAVVQEQLSAAPSGGHMQFVGSSAPTMSDMPGATGYPVGGTYPPYDQAEESRSKAPLIALFGMLMLAGVGIAAYVMSSGATTTTPTPPVAATGPVIAAPQPEPEPNPNPEHVKELAPETPKVMLTIETNDGAGNPVVARVVDAVDDGIYGRTNGEQGVSVEKSSEMHSFILRADGFEDLVMEFVPFRDKRFVKELKAKTDKSGKIRGGGSKPSKAKAKDKGVSAYDLPGVAPSPKTRPPKNEPKPAPKPELKPSPLPEAKPDPKPEPALKPSKDATPKAPPKKKKGAKAGELVNPFDG